MRTIKKVNNIVIFYMTQNDILGITHFFKKFPSLSHFFSKTIYWQTLPLINDFFYGIIKEIAFIWEEGIYTEFNLKIKLKKNLPKNSNYITKMPNYLKGKLPQFGVGDELIFRLYMIYRVDWNLKKYIQK